MKRGKASLCLRCAHKLEMRKKQRRNEEIMGKLILCSGMRTSRPYTFSPSGIRMYSMEELCYFLYNHVYMIEEDLFSYALFDWIELELGLKDRADKLRQLRKHNADIKTMVTVILCSADYYSEGEIKGLLRVLDDVIGMSQIKRKCIKAGSYIKNRQYLQAAKEYEKIINSKEAIDLSPEEYGDVYHNLAVAKAHITGLKEASGLFCQAYERNHKQESLIAYLFTLRLCSNEEVYRQRLIEYQVEPELESKIEEYLAKKKEEAEQTELMLQIEHLKKMKDRGKISECYNKAGELIDNWKSQVRQS